MKSEQRRHKTVFLPPLHHHLPLLLMADLVHRCSGPRTAVFALSTLNKPIEEGGGGGGGCAHHLTRRHRMADWVMIEQNPFAASRPDNLRLTKGGVFLNVCLFVFFCCCFFKANVRKRAARARPLAYVKSGGAEYTNSTLLGDFFPPFSFYISVLRQPS